MRTRGYDFYCLTRAAQITAGAGSLLRLRMHRVYQAHRKHCFGKSSLQFNRKPSTHVPFPPALGNDNLDRIQLARCGHIRRYRLIKRSPAPGSPNSSRPRIDHRPPPARRSVVNRRGGLFERPTILPIRRSSDTPCCRCPDPRDRQARPQYSPPRRRIIA